MTLTRRHKSAITVPPVPPLTGKETEAEAITRRSLIQIAEAVRRLATDGDASYGSLPAPHGATHDADGSDPLTTPGDPSTIEAGDSADPGVGPAAAREDHQHQVVTGTPSHVALAGAAGAPSEGVSTGLARADHDHGAIKRETEVMSAGVSVGVRGKVNIVSGATVVDNAGADRVDITIPASASSILTTAGDIIVRDATAPVRHGIGAQHALLEVETANADKVQWSDLVTILGRLLTTEGDLLVRDSGGATRTGTVSTDHGHVHWTDSTKAGFVNTKRGFPHRGHWIQDSIVDNTPTELFRVTVANPTDTCIVHLRYGVECYFGTDEQIAAAECKALLFKDPGGTVHAALTAVVMDGAIVPAGTLTVTPTVSIVGDDVLVLITIDSDLGSPYDYAACHFEFKMTSFDLPVTLEANVYSR